MWSSKRINKLVWDFSVSAQLTCLEYKGWFGFRIRLVKKPGSHLLEFIDAEQSEPKKTSSES